jgi:hypothetical protein
LIPEAFLAEIRGLIESARQRATAAVNSELTLMFWRIGRRIHMEVLAGERAEYGEQVIVSLAAHLTRDYGSGFAEKSLRRMVQFADKHERAPEEASPLGIILCTGKKTEQIELLELDKSGIHVAEYLTALPPRETLIDRLEQATRRAKMQVRRIEAEPARNSQPG